MPSVIDHYLGLIGDVSDFRLIESRSVSITAVLCSNQGYTPECRICFEILNKADAMKKSFAQEFMVLCTRNGTVEQPERERP
jgi:hypothetical protein